MRNSWTILLATAAVLSVGCGDDDTTTSQAGGGGMSASSSTGSASGGGGMSASSSTGSASGGGSSSGGAAPSNCFQSEADMIVMEAESLPINDSWEIRSDEPGYNASGYILWTRDSQNNNPGQGLMAITLRFAQAGRYRLQWRNRIGMGSNTTEHNDTWVRFPDAADYYGLQGSPGNESRRYHRPSCEDPMFLNMVTADPDVADAACVEGSSTQGWLKVYSSGANDWRWSTNTNDNNAYAVMVEIDAPGDYAFELSARADFHLIDRIVIHEQSIPDASVEDLAAPETPCR